MTARRLALVVGALWALAGTACGVIAGDALTDAQQVIADMKIGPADPKDEALRVVAAIEPPDLSYRAGEPISLSVQVNKDAYLAAIRVLPNGVTTLVFPNRDQPSAKIAANTSLRIPAPGSSLRVTAEKPGVVLFEFIASSRGDSWLFSRKPQDSADFAELGTTTRALAKDILLSLKIGHGPETGASHVVLRVRAP